MNHRDLKLLQEHARKGLLPESIKKVKPKDYPFCPYSKFGDSNQRAAQNRGKIMQESTDAKETVESKAHLKHLHRDSTSISRRIARIMEHSHPKISVKQSQKQNKTLPCVELAHIGKTE